MVNSMADCKTIQKMIDDFDNNILSIEEQEMFMNHLENCKDCREELEIHYIIKYGLQDEDDLKNVEPEFKKYLDGYDFKGYMNLKLKKCYLNIEKSKRFSNTCKMCYLCANLCVVLAIALFFIIEYL